MAVTDFPTKAAIVVRDDLAVWQRLNVTGFLMSGLAGGSGERVVGDDYVDGDGEHYLPMLVQPLLVLEASGPKLQTVRRRAADRGVRIAIYTAELSQPAMTRRTGRPCAPSRPTSSTWSDSACAPRTGTRMRSCAASAGTADGSRRQSRRYMMCSPT